ncbi:tyrosine-type recombinase/integrase [Desulfovibrio sp. OttesenSCG-928-G11]|nr:tyrosine-type recombinase/integrase [Desulfovibrio sp. OttesenSCG-928-G11]
MFPNRKRSDYLFPKKGGKPNERREQVSNAFKEVLGDLRINKDLSDERGKGVFHTLRHTFASWLVQDGEPLFKVGRLMGQKTPAMTNRYSHLAPDSFQDAAAKLNCGRL